MPEILSVILPSAFFGSQASPPVVYLVNTHIHNYGCTCRNMYSRAAIAQRRIIRRQASEKLSVATHLLDTVFWTDVHLECFNLFGCSSASEVHYAAFACGSQTRYSVHPAIRAARSMLVGSLYTTESLPIVGKYVASLLCATYAVPWQH